MTQLRDIRDDLQFKLQQEKAKQEVTHRQFSQKERELEVLLQDLSDKTRECQEYDEFLQETGNAYRDLQRSRASLSNLISQDARRISTLGWADRHRS